MKINFLDYTRREFMKTAAIAAAAGAAPSALVSEAFAATEEERIIAAAKRLNPVGLRGMIWSNYMAAMKQAEAEFKKATGISVESIQDISIFVIPQRAMAEAVSRSDKFDFFHVDSNMIPSLASARLLEPLDKYMKQADFKIDAVGDYGRFMTYQGETYGVPTDGNVHVQFMRWDLVEAGKKAFEDKYGKSPAWPVTWEDDQQMMEFFHKPDEGVWGSANLRNRANGVTWWYMYFYSAGGFPFDDEMNPTLNNAAGQYALDTYLNIKKVSHPEATGWGTPQMIPRMTGGKVFSGQYWDGIVALNENPEKSKTVGQWKYGLVPGSDFSGKRIYRSISDPLGALLVNKHSPRKALAAYLAMWLTTEQESEAIVADPANTFHDPWAKSHMTSDVVAKTYTKGGLEGIQQCLQVSAPPIYLTGYMEFTDILNKNLSEAYVGSISVSEGIKKTQEEFAGIVKKTGKRKLKAELASYKAVMPKVDAPS